MSSVIRGSDNFDSGYGLGVGQTWQDVTASRLEGTPYTNDTGKPIFVNIYGNSASGGTTISLTVDGVECRGSTASQATQTAAVSLLIPPGSSYTLTFSSAGEVARWSELR